MISDFLFPVEFRIDILFPHIFWFLRIEWGKAGSLVLSLQVTSVGDETKTITSLLDTGSPMIALPVLPQSAFRALKN